MVKILSEIGISLRSSFILKQDSLNMPRDISASFSMASGGDGRTAGSSVLNGTPAGVMLCGSASVTGTVSSRRTVGGWMIQATTPDTVWWTIEAIYTRMIFRKEVTAVHPAPWVRLWKLLSGVWVHRWCTSSGNHIGLSLEEPIMVI